MKQPQKVLRARAGFTLVELVVVISVIVLLAGVLVPVVSTQVEKAKTARAASDMKEVGNAFNTYFLDTGVWPSNADVAAVSTATEELANYYCLYQNSYTKSGWDGPYLNEGVALGASGLGVAKPSGSGQEGVTDPWSKNYIVFFLADGFNRGPGGIVLASRGPNGLLDTTQTQAWGGQAAGDDVLYVVTRKL